MNGLGALAGLERSATALGLRFGFESKDESGALGSECPRARRFVERIVVVAHYSQVARIDRVTDTGAVDCAAARRSPNKVRCPGLRIQVTLVLPFAK